jgi:hypothetical protein
MRPKFSHVVAGVLAMCGTATHAQLMLDGPVDFQGTGLGAVNTVLTIQSPGSSSTEAGSVWWNGSMDVASGDAKHGSSQTQTRTLGDLGIRSAADLRVVFNALEPGNLQNSIDLVGLTLGVYDAAGTRVFSASIPQSYAFADTFTGAGNSGFVFSLTGQSAAELQSIFSSDLHIGLTASAANATGGFETFFIASAANVVSSVPEPPTLALTLAGLAVVGFLGRKRKQRG